MTSASRLFQTHRAKWLNRRSPVAIHVGGSANRSMSEVNRRVGTYGGRGRCDG